MCENFTIRLTGKYAHPVSNIKRLRYAEEEVWIFNVCQKEIRQDRLKNDEKLKKLIRFEISESTCLLGL